jgi:hypothetical protein
MGLSCIDDYNRALNPITLRVSERERKRIRESEMVEAFK